MTPNALCSKPFAAPLNWPGRVLARRTTFHQRSAKTNHTTTKGTSLCFATAATIFCFVLLVCSRELNSTFWLSLKCRASLSVKVSHFHFVH